MFNRRDVLSHGASVAGLMAAAGVLPDAARAADVPGYARAAFDAKSVAEVMKALGAAAPAESKDVVLQAPDIAENGAVVPLAASVTAPGVKRLLILVEKNPNTLAAIFDITEAVEPSISTRVKMGQSSNVYAVAMMGDGRTLFARKDVRVTLGGCG